MKTEWKCFGINKYCSQKRLHRVQWRTKTRSEAFFFSFFFSCPLKFYSAFQSDGKYKRQVKLKTAESGISQCNATSHEDYRIVPDCIMKPGQTLFTVNKWGLPKTRWATFACSMHARYWTQISHQYEAREKCAVILRSVLINLYIAADV